MQFPFSKKKTSHLEVHTIAGTRLSVPESTEVSRLHTIIAIEISNRSRNSILLHEILKIEYREGAVSPQRTMLTHAFSTRITNEETIVSHAEKISSFDHCPSSMCMLVSCCVRTHASICDTISPRIPITTSGVYKTLRAGQWLYSLLSNRTARHISFQCPVVISLSRLSPA